MKTPCADKSEGVSYNCFTNCMKTIPLTQGKYAIVDDEDYEYINKWKWHARKDKRNFYAARGVVVDRKKHRVKLFFIHNEIMKPKDGMLVDHVDHDGLNNKRNNLRICTDIENRMNRRKCPTVKGKKCSSKYKGVCLKGKKWFSYIGGKKKYKCIGLFDNEIDAAKAYDEFAKIMYGRFANLNFPQII